MVEAREGSKTGPMVHIKDAVKQKVYYCANGHKLRPIQGRLMPWHYRHVRDRNCAFQPSDGWDPRSP